MRVAGVDGTKDGWVAVVLEDGRFEGAQVIRPVETEFSGLEDVVTIAVDVPIGFGPRKADAAARVFVSGAASTVFTTPARDVLERPFGPGLGVSAQAHALGPRILHVTRLARADERIREIHPEVSFRAMNGGRRLRYRKKTGGGALERIEILRRHGITIDDAGEAAEVPLADLLDAAAAAWSAHRVATGTARSLPAPPETIDGYPVAIWY